MIYRIVYSSKEKTPFSNNDIQVLLQKSQTSNLANAISGMLIYIEGDFLQIIEGSKENVNNLYEKIESDNRHCSPKIIFKDYVEARQFPDWSMGFSKLSYYELKKNKSFKDIEKLSLTNIHDDIAVNFIAEFIKFRKSDIQSTVTGFIKSSFSSNE